MSLRRYAPMKQSEGTRWPAAEAEAIWQRDGGRCVGPRLTPPMPGDCYGEPQKDHVRASGAIGKKSRSTADNGALLCSPHHRLKTDNGRVWRPPLLAWIAARAGPAIPHG